MNDGTLPKGRINVRRGLFRVWIIASIAFIAAVALTGFDDLRRKFETLSSVRALEAKQAVVVDLSEARGTKGTDYYIADEMYRMCWYGLSRYRELYPESKNLSDKALITATYKKASESLFLASPLARVRLGGRLSPGCASCGSWNRPCLRLGRRWL